MEGVLERMNTTWRRGLMFVLLVALAAAGAAPAAAAQEQLILLDVHIVGNEHVPVETIRETMTQTRLGEPLDLDAINSDLMNVYELGYFYDVVPYLEEVPGARSGVRLVVEVYEFPVVQTLSIASEGVPADVVRSWMTTREGRILNAREFEQDMLTVQERAVEEYDVYLRPAFVDLNDETGEVTVEFKAARVGEIVIEGHEKTKEHVIAREITFEVGDILNRAQVRRTLQRLNLLGYFQTVDAEFYEIDDPDALGVRIRVEERKTGLASFGAGYSTESGFIGYVEAADDNFLGNGQRVNLRWEFGKARSMYDLGFYEPYFLGTPTPLGFNLYNRTQERVIQAESGKVAVRNHEAGGHVSVGRPLGEFTRGFLRYKLENWDETVEGTPTRQGSTRSVALSVRTDTTNHLFSPTEGFRSHLSVERAGGFLGGTVEFTKYEAQYSTYLKVGRREGQAVALRAMYGQVNGENLPLREKFVIGGADTMRGYDYGALTGDRMLVFNTEFRFPIVNSVQGVIFADFGNAFEAGEPVRLSDLKTGYGVGVRLDTPIGILRIDYAFREDGGRTYFSFGPTF